MNGCFIPLGGADEVGASCYYLNLNGKHMVLDCGARKRGDEIYPYLGYLNKIGADILDNLDVAVISHAHFDHIGALPYLHQCAPNACFISTETTRILAGLQFMQWNRDISHRQSDHLQSILRENTEHAVSRIRTVPVMRACNFEGIHITLYPAGHMAGAAMAHIQSNGFSVLYTGDFSTTSHFGINDMRLAVKKPDLLILCGTYAYGSQKNQHYDAMREELLSVINAGRSVFLICKSMSKFLDIAYLLNDMRLEVPVYLSKEVQATAEHLETAGYRIYSDAISDIHAGKRSLCVVISSNERQIGNQHVIYADKYSQHCDYDELKAFVQAIQPKQTFLVHTYPRENGAENLINEFFGRMDIIQCRNLNTYKF